METINAIYFHNLKNDFYYMSNFFLTSFSDDNGNAFNCSEQYFMYHKCLTFDNTTISPNNISLLNNILFEKSPAKIKAYGRQVKNFDDKIWDNIKYNIMLDGLRFKFKQNIIINNKLKATNNKIIYEASKYDKIWGIGYSDYEAISINPSKYGQNLLGKALMEIRSEIL
jgi:hypothetical protein